MQQASQPRCQDLQRSLMSLHHKAPILGPGAGPRTPGELRVVADYGRLHKALELKQRHGTTWQTSSKSCKIKQIRIPWLIGILDSCIWTYLGATSDSTCRECKINVDNPASWQSASANCQGKYDACSISQKLTPNL